MTPWFSSRLVFSRSVLLKFKWCNHLVVQTWLQLERTRYDALIISKVSDHSRGRPEGSFFNSYYTESFERALLLFLDCSILPLIRILYCWVLSKAVSSTILKVFGMTRPGIETRSPGPLRNYFIDSLVTDICSGKSGQFEFEWMEIFLIIFFFFLLVFSLLVISYCYFNTMRSHRIDISIFWFDRFNFGC